MTDTPTIQLDAMDPTPESELQVLQKKHNRFLEDLGGQLKCIADIDAVLSVLPNYTRAFELQQKAEADVGRLEKERAKDLHLFKEQLECRKKEVDDMREQFRKDLETLKNTFEERMDKRLTIIQNSITSTLTKAEEKQVKKNGVRVFLTRLGL